MLTRHKFTPPIPTGDSATDFRNLCRSISDFFGALEQKNALQIDSAQIRAASGIVFPASQGAASSDANTLDDYAEGTWTPADASGAGLTLSVTSARYTKVGRFVSLTGDVTYPATADASQALIGGAPFSPATSVPGAVAHNSAAAISVSQISVSGGNPVVNFSTSTGGAVSNTNLSGKVVRFSITYSI
jgi:hypothetical protein